VIFREKRQGQPERLNAGSLHYVVLSVRFVRDRCAPGEHLWQVIAINSFGSLKKETSGNRKLVCEQAGKPGRRGFAREWTCSRVSRCERELAVTQIVGTQH
jgi:hypothetical protein